VTDNKLGPWVRRFLLEHLVGERNLARNTQRSYRDSLALLIPFVAGKMRKEVDQLEIDHFTAEQVRQFLQHLEEARGCSVPTRNQRLAAIHALAHFIAERGPEHIEWCGQIQAVPFKRAAKASITYLEKPEMDALLAAPDRNSALGRRDYALLLFLYNTGARADEAAQLNIADLRLAEAPHREHSSVQIRGKECHSYCISFRRRNETTIIHACRQAYDLAFSLADVLLVVHTGIGLGPYTDTCGAGRVGPMSELSPA
jgi:integrase/recombinase XerD